MHSCIHAKARGFGSSPGAVQPKAVSTTLDAATKARVETKAQEWIDKVLKPRHVKPPPEDARFNYVSDITLKWHGSTLFLVAVYACPGPNALSPSFESRVARLKPANDGRFDLDFMRYTGQWVPLHQGLTFGPVIGDRPRRTVVHAVTKVGDPA